MVLVKLSGLAADGRAAKVYRIGKNPQKSRKLVLNKSSTVSADDSSRAAEGNCPHGCKDQIEFNS